MEEKEIRLIDANALLERLRDEILLTKVEYSGLTTYRKTREIIESTPTIDPESLRPRAKWELHNSGSGTCSNCHRVSVAVWDFDNVLNYCPDCGAKMDQED